MSKNWILISKHSFHLSYSLVLSQTLWNLGVAEPLVILMPLVSLPARIK